MIYVDKDGLKTVSDLIKTGHIIKACKTQDNLIGLTLVDLNTNNNVYAYKSDNLENCLENLTDYFSKVQDKFSDRNILTIAIDNCLNSLILNNDFQLKIGCKVTLIENNYHQVQQKLFDSYYFSLSNGVLSTEVSNQSIQEGLSSLSTVSKNRFINQIQA